jgi:hypothetical protein
LLRRVAFFLSIVADSQASRRIDRNRAAIGIGYSISDTSRLRLKDMQQLDETSKGQLLLNWIQTL